MRKGEERSWKQEGDTVISRIFMVKEKKKGMVTGRGMGWDKIHFCIILRWEILSFYLATESKLPQTGWPKTIEKYPLMVLEDRGLKLISQQDHTTSRCYGENLSLPLPILVASGIPQFSRLCHSSLYFLGHIFLFPFLCLHLLYSLFLGYMSSDLGHNWIIHGDLISRSLTQLGLHRIYFQIK